MIRGLTEVAFLVCVVARVLVWMVLVREFRKKKKNGGDC